MMHTRMTMLALALGLPATAMAQGGEYLKPDTPTQLDNVEAVCTGVGSTARQNPAWAAYPLKIEFTGRGGRYLGDVHLILLQDGQAIAAVSCDGPWFLFKLPPGRYRVEAETGGRKTTATAKVPAGGQRRIILRMPEPGGETSLSAPEIRTAAR